MKKRARMDMAIRALFYVPSFRTPQSEAPSPNICKKARVGADR